LIIDILVISVNQNVFYENELKFTNNRALKLAINIAGKASDKLHKDREEGKQKRGSKE
jgi:hypothetical protein